MMATLRANLEPQIELLHTGVDMNTELLCSIAISLKRLADLMETYGQVPEVLIHELDDPNKEV
jgi:hypothetical protein